MAQLILIKTSAERLSQTMQILQHTVLLTAAGLHGVGMRIMQPCLYCHVYLDQYFEYLEAHLIGSEKPTQ